LAVVFETAVTVCLPVDGLHLVMEAFCDSVAPGEAPHACDLLSPGVEGVAEGDELCEAGLAEIGDCAQEARDQLLALFTGFVLLQQQVAEPLLKPIDFVQRGVLGHTRAAVPAARV
jgi:hypothetical protein